MAILDDDDVNEVKNVNEQEIKMDSYIKKIIENVLEVQLKEHKEIASIAKTKIAEVTLELEKLKQLEKATTKYRDDTNIITNKMIENVENYNKVFLERIDKFNLLMVEKLNEVKNTNQIFAETLDKSDIVDNLNKSRAEIFEKFSTDVATKTNNTFNLVENSLNKLKIAFYTAVSVIVIFLFFTGIILYKTNNRVASVEESLNNISSSVTGLVKGDLKFWYSEEDKKAYVSNVESIKKNKDSKKKK